MRRCIVAGQRVVEDNHQTVTGEPFERALEAEDEVSERGVVFTEHAHHLFGFAGFSERGEAPEVAEHDDDFAPMTVQERFVTGVER